MTCISVCARARARAPAFTSLKRESMAFIRVTTEQVCNCPFLLLRLETWPLGLLSPCLQFAKSRERMHRYGRGGGSVSCFPCSSLPSISLSVRAIRECCPCHATPTPTPHLRHPPPPTALTGPKLTA